MKKEYTPWLKCSYTAPNTARNRVISKYTKAVRRAFRSFFRVSDVNNVAHAPFLLVSAVGGGRVDDLPVENHG